ERAFGRSSPGSGNRREIASPPRTGQRTPGHGGRRMSQEHAVVVGFGLMGCDIAAIFLAGGWRVSAVETERTAWPAREARVRSSLEQLDADPGRAGALRILATLEEVDFADAAVVIEAVPEQLELKRQVFATLDRLVP